MNYINTIITALVIFPIISFIFTIPFVLYQYHKYGSVNKKRILIVYSFILYMITIYFLVILPLPKKEEVVNNTNMMNLKLFNFISDFIKETSLVINEPSTYLKALTEPCFYVVIFNILMTMPFGMYLRYYFKCNFVKTSILGFLLSLFFELTQLTGLYFIYPKPYRLFDVDDLFLNTLGTMLGYFIMGFIIKHLPTRDSIDTEAYKDGMIVTGFRRLTLFCLDMFIYIFVMILLDVLLKLDYMKYITFAIYYIVLPILTKGQTLGAIFLNVKIDYNKYFALKTIIRNIWINLYYIAVPYFIFYFMRQLVSSDFIMILYLSLLVIVILFYPVNIIKLLKNNEMFYDEILKTKYISTIKNKYELKN